MEELMKRSNLNVLHRPDRFDAHARDHAVTLRSEPWVQALISLFMVTRGLLR
jgi:hypothetical protein